MAGAACAVVVKDAANAPAAAEVVQTVRVAVIGPAVQVAQTGLVVIVQNVVIAHAVIVQRAAVMNLEVIATIIATA